MNSISGAAVTLSWLSFVVFIVGAVSSVITQWRAAGVAKGAPENLKNITAADTEGVIKALTALTEALVKAGPALAALVASIFFLLIAAWSDPVNTECSIPKGTVMPAAGELQQAVAVSCKTAPNPAKKA